jgi:hypothetical protein
MIKPVRALLCLAMTSGALLSVTPPASASSNDSYQVLCVIHTLPSDPQPYRVCVYEPV